eukprot:SAG31_NODE_18557_length_632_cov_0.714822_1_plen_77_part_00
MHCRILNLNPAIYSIVLAYTAILNLVSHSTDPPGGGLGEAHLMPRQPPRPPMRARDARQLLHQVLNLVLAYLNLAT